MQQRQIRLTQHLAPQPLNGVPFAIYLVLRNLIANAVLYTPPGGQVEVSSLRVDERLLLRVDDSGNGIAEADRVRVFARYTRLQPHHAEGIGLGLSIVQQAVQLHAAHIRLERAPCGGLRVEISFPA
jgi:signal transduction histidine kinase